MSKKDLINSDMLKLGLGIYDESTEEEQFVTLEEFLNGISSKPLTYYGSVTNAVIALKNQGYGKIEIPPTTDNPLCYIVATKDADSVLRLNLHTFGSKAPIRNVRPYSIDGELNWQVGDIIYNSDFLINRCLGWICTSPAGEENGLGTWEMFNNLDESKDKTTFTIVPYGEDLPAANVNQLSKFILYSNAVNKDYHLYYCTRHYERNSSTGVYQVKYVWKDVSGNDSPVRRAKMIYQYEGWQLTSIEDLQISDKDESYLKEVPSFFAVCTKVPVPENTDPNEIQTLKIGNFRYRVHYINNDYVYEGDILSGIPIIIYIDLINGAAYLPFSKPKEVDLPLVSVLPEASIANFGKRILFQNPATEDYPSMYYCTQISKPDNTLEFKWIKPENYKIPSYSAVLEDFYDDSWNIVSVGEYTPQDSNFSTKVNTILLLTSRTPSDSKNNQAIKLKNEKFQLRYLDGTYIGEKDIVKDSIITFQLDRTRHLATISSTPPPIPFEDKTIVKVAAVSATDNNRWKISSISDYQVANNVLFQSELPDKLILVFQIPTNSKDNQMIEIGSVEYNLNYINGVPVMANELTAGTIITVQGSLTSNRFYLPAFPSTEAQQNADFSAVNNRIDSANLKIENTRTELNNYKVEVNSKFVQANQSVQDLRDSIHDIVGLKFAPLDSPELTGSPVSTTPEQNDSSNRIATTKFVMKAIANLINSSPESLNTLSELAEAINNDPNFAATMINKLAQKLDISGGTILNTLILVNNNEVLSTRYNNPALVVGGARSAPHIEMGVTQIQAKEKENSSSTLYLNPGGGIVIIGAGGLQINGDVTISGNLRVAGSVQSDSEMIADQFKGNASSATVAYNIPTENLGGNIWIERRE